jgi:hypothetical protein
VNAQEDDSRTQTAILRAILALMVDERGTRATSEGQLPTEILLSNAGLDYKVVASLLGKKPDAVRMMLARRTKAGE